MFREKFDIHKRTTPNTENYTALLREIKDYPRGKKKKQCIVSMDWNVSCQEDVSGVLIKIKGSLCKAIVGTKMQSFNSSNRDSEASILLEQNLESKAFHKQIAHWP